MLVVDDGSTDESAALVEREFPGVRLLRQSNAGAAAARNRGIREARGDWVAFIDADDLWLPGKLQAQLSLLARNTASSMVYAAWETWESVDAEPCPGFLQQIGAKSTDVKRWDGPSGWIYPELLVDAVVWTSTVVIRRALLLELGGFDETLFVGEDYDLWLRASRETPILRVPAPLAVYRLHSESITRGVPARNSKGEVVERALQRWGYQSPDGRSARPRAVARGLARSWADYAGANLDAGNLGRARGAAMRAISLDPTTMLGWVVLSKWAHRCLVRRQPRDET